MVDGRPVESIFGENILGASLTISGMEATEGWWRWCQLDKQGQIWRTLSEHWNGEVAYTSERHGEVDRGAGVATLPYQLILERIFRGLGGP